MVVIVDIALCMISLMCTVMNAAGTLLMYSVSVLCSIKYVVSARWRFLQLLMANTAAIIHPGCQQKAVLIRYFLNTRWSQCCNLLRKGKCLVNGYWYQIIPLYTTWSCTECCQQLHSKDGLRIIQMVLWEVWLWNTCALPLTPLKSHTLRRLSV